MKSVLCFFALLTVVTTCTQPKEDVEAKAVVLLDDARLAMNEECYDKARQLVDSLRTTYPKAVQTRRNALRFMDTLELNNAKHELAQKQLCWEDSSRILAALKREFNYERDPKYQSIGFYTSKGGSKSQPGSRAEVSEDGKIVINSKTDAASNSRAAVLSAAIKNVNSLNEQVEHTKLKVRFYERKIEINADSI